MMTLDLDAIEKQAHSLIDFPVRAPLGIEEAGKTILALIAEVRRLEAYIADLKRNG